MQHVQGLRSPGLQALRPAPRAPAGGRQPASRRGACVVRASASEELEGWQVQKLQQALLAGRRQVQVRAAGAAAGATEPSIPACKPELGRACALRHVWQWGAAAAAAACPSPADAVPAPRSLTSPLQLCLQVEKLCKELNLPRGTVLQWLKTAPPPDR